MGPHHANKTNFRGGDGVLGISHSGSVLDILGPSGEVGHFEHFRNLRAPEP